MNLIKCENGHFYDAERFPSCPHCSGGNSVAYQPTMPAETVDFGATVIEETTIPEPQPPAKEEKKPIPEVTADTQKTVGYFEDAIGAEPVGGWLVCIEGKHFGEDFRLVAGRNFIGRSSSMAVNLSGDASISRDKHAVIVYEPKSNAYMIQPGTSKELCYLNDQVVLEAKQIFVNDIITLGSTKLMFVPCCSDKFNWSDTQKQEEE